MRKIYTATQRSIADYAGAAWAPWLSKSNLEKVERAQATQIVTGNTLSTPVEAVLQEAGLEPLGGGGHKTKGSRGDNKAKDKQDGLERAEKEGAGKDKGGDRRLGPGG